MFDSTNAQQLFADLPALNGCAVGIPPRCFAWASCFTCGTIGSPVGGDDGSFGDSNTNTQRVRMVISFFRFRQYAGFVFRLLIASSCALPALARDDPPPDPGSTAILRDGSMQSLKLVGTTAAGDWIFDAASQRVTVANDQLIVWGACEERGQRTWVLLTDGSLIVSELLAIEKEALVLTGRIWPETRVARQHVRAILFRQPMDCLARDLLYHRAIFQERDEDQLLLDNGDELKGAMPEEVRPEPGAFHPERIRWPDARHRGRESKCRWNALPLCFSPAERTLLSQRTEQRGWV